MVMMTKKLRLGSPCVDKSSPRVGGGALIQNRVEWPSTPNGALLTLIMSLPTSFLNEHAGFSLPAGHFVSVFSYYSEDEYFLDAVTYHGSREELDWLRTGFTKVMLHEPGDEMFRATTIPAMRIDVEDIDLGIHSSFGGSKIGGEPNLLQAEPLQLEDQQFALQVYGNDFPRPYHGIFGLSDATGYVFINPAPPFAPTASEAGTFFVQVT